MADLGLRFVRIGEFAWSRLEPERDRFEWAWLDRVLDVLSMAGLQVVLGTPTAAPPKWLVDQRPDILAWDADGRPRRFGSRRHYCFSSPAWREETARICLLMAKRYGDHPVVVGWQLDNEYGGHDTVLSYAPHCRVVFQRWLERRHGTIERLNHVWGTAFWGQSYAEFSQIGLPHQTVAMANPSHMLDFRRFASDEVIGYNRMQAEIIRQHSPERFISHNCMGLFHDFDHGALARDLDMVTWNSCPLGLTDRCRSLDSSAKTQFARTGHPDIAAWHHDLYRGVSPEGRFWVMEQQPGPASSADHNPIPAPGMVRLWTLEALAHGAETVSYFHWRQAPFAQEQMRAGLLRRDGEPAPAFAEIRTVRDELRKLAPDGETTRQAKIAIVADDQSHWICDIQPHGADFDLGRLNLAFYTACRRLGQDVDVVRPNAGLADYRLVLIPCLPIISLAAEEVLAGFDGEVIVGPRTGSKTRDMQIPEDLPPGVLQSRLPLKVGRVASLPPGMDETVVWRDRSYPVAVWQEEIVSQLEPLGRFADGGGAIFRAGRWHYLAFWPDPAFLMDYLEAVLDELGLDVRRLPETLRVRRRGGLAFAFNYGSEPVAAPVADGTSFLVGGPEIGACDVAVWRD